MENIQAINDDDLLSNQCEQQDFQFDQSDGSFDEINQIQQSKKPFISQDANEDSQEFDIFEPTVVRNPFSQENSITNSLKCKEKSQLSSKLNFKIKKKTEQLRILPPPHPEEEGQKRTRKKRANIGMQLLNQLKILFDAYDSNIESSNKEKLSLRSIAKKMRISSSQTKLLYDEYKQDSFYRRLHRLKFPQRSQWRKSKPQTLIPLRLRFIQDLLSRDLNMTQKDIAKQMSKVENLAQYNSKGQLVEINRKTIQQLMKIGNFRRKKVGPVQRNSNTNDYIRYRFEYARRYLEVTEDPMADIFFIGQFFFGSSSSSSLSYWQQSIEASQKNRIEVENISSDIKCIKGENKRSKVVQFCAVIGLSGIAYYEIYENIFQELNLTSLLQKTVRIMFQNNSHKKKYLIVETSPLHSRIELKKIEDQKNITVLFLPSGAHMLNPTQYLFHDINHIVKARAYKLKASYSPILHEVLENYRVKFLGSYFHCLKPYVELALKKQPFK